jgi:hypothetical protein
MQTDELNRRLAAWLLTLPGPWDAASSSDALARIRRAFDPRINDADLQRALADMGYALVATAGARFRIEPIEAPPQLADHAPGAAPRRAA